MHLPLLLQVAPDAAIARVAGVLPRQDRRLAAEDEQAQTSN